MSDLRRKKQEKRLAEESFKSSENPRRRWIDGVSIVLTVVLGLGAAYHLAKIEWAIPFGLASLACTTFLLGEIPRVRRTFKLSIRLQLQFIFATAVMAAFYPSVGAEYRKQHAALTVGTLEPLSKGIATAPLLELADSGVTDSMDREPNGQWELLRYQPIKVEIENGTPQFSTIIRDRSGNIIVEVKKNHWFVSSSQTVVWDKNYTCDTLEVKDGRGKVVLQVKILPDRVQLQGEWHDEKGRGVRLAKTHAPLVEGGAQILPLNNFDDELPAFEIRAIFKYPSADFWKELEKK